MLDFHNHLIPGVDDGAADIDESRAALEAMVADGVTGVIATPHITASLAQSPGLARYEARVSEGWGRLQTLAAR